MTEQPNRQKFAGDGITAPLRYTVFRRIWLASLLSNLGLLIQGVLPIMLISMPAGAIADMYDRRIVTLVSLMIALTGATALTVLAGFNLIT